MIAPEKSQNSISSQAVGAYGEKAVEAELLRFGWMPSNVNASVKNAEAYDIFALKNGHTVHLRVKTCGPGMNAFQFGGFVPGEDIPSAKLIETDFTVLVRMGINRLEDHFYIAPTQIVRETLNTYRKFYLAQVKKDGGARKDTGHWTLHLTELTTGEDRPNYGLAKKWSQYLNNWTSLDG